MRAGKGSKFESGVIASRISHNRQSPSNVKIVYVPRAPIREPRTLRSVRKMQSLVVWLAVVSAAWALAGACSSSISKRPARPARPAGAAAAPGLQAPPPQPRVNVTFPTFKCEPDYSEYYCLNGGECFTVVISGSPIYNCECRSGFVGQRCEFKDLDDSYVLTSRQLMMETASIAGGATVAVFLALLVCFGAWVRLRRRAPAAGKLAPGGAAESGVLRVQLVALAAPGRPARSRTLPPAAPGLVALPEPGRPLPARSRALPPCHQRRPRRRRPRRRICLRADRRPHRSVYSYVLSVERTRI
ncbi:uncharacterized protein [Choristoneura fumiferana]|uniref:uncharacterized protein n=1 Tax=Choristoneura fumiferana TaxID=7141 RepID=UPI003D15AD56